MRRRMSPGHLAYRFRSLAEPSREFVALRKNLGWLKEQVPDGDGRPLMFLPGFGAGDYTTGMMRRFFAGKGYSAYGWDNGVNWGPSETTIRKVSKRLREIHEKHDGQKVTLIGHSLGGVLARELARDYPHMVSQVITMGSPFGIGKSKQATSPLIRNLFDMLHGGNSPVKDKQILRQMLVPPPVPTTSIYSRNDKVVSWQASINPKARRAENVEVKASHIGLVFNIESYIVVGDRLAQKDGHWRRFDKSKYPDTMFYERAMHDDYGFSLDKEERKKPHRPIFKPGPK